MDFFFENPALVSVAALLLAMPLVWWLARRQGPTARVEPTGDRLDTLAGWPPEPQRIMRSSERLAFSTLKLALPGYLILSQVPISRFVAVPKRNSHAEWMRRLGNQCVDFLICDVSSQVIAVVEIMPPAEQMTDRLKARLQRVERVLGAAGIKVHTWNEERLPSIESARMKIVPGAPAIPADLRKRVVAAGAPAAAAMAVAELATPQMAFADTSPQPVPFADTLPQPEASVEGEPDWARGGEVIEVLEPNATWFDDIEVTAELPPPDKR